MQVYEERADKKNNFLPIKIVLMISIKIDETDLKILDRLQQNAKATVKELSEQLNLSTTPIFERIKKLEKAGVVDRYQAVFNFEELGHKLHAFAHILRSTRSLLPKSFSTFPKSPE